MYSIYRSSTLHFRDPLTFDTHTHTHTHTHTEAVVVFDYTKEQDDELTLNVGDVIKNVVEVHNVLHTCTYIFVVVVAVFLFFFGGGVGGWISDARK